MVGNRNGFNFSRLMRRAVECNQCRHPRIFKSRKPVPCADHSNFATDVISKLCEFALHLAASGIVHSLLEAHKGSGLFYTSPGPERTLLLRQADDEMRGLALILT